MKKTFKLLNNLFISSLLCFSSAITLVSCNNDEKEEEIITSIQLFSNFDTIKPGEEILIKAIALPSSKRIDNLIWSIEDTEYIDKITVDNSGKITISNDIVLDDLTTFTVKAALINDVEIFATKTMYVLPKQTADFQGFVGNDLMYLDRYHNIQHATIKTNDNKNYYVDQNIDLFEMDIDDRPAPLDTSPICFKPIMSEQSFSYMRFEITNNKRGKPCIEWDGYEENNWIRVEPDQENAVPSFILLNPSQVYNSIVVHFANAPEVTLTINFTLWQSRQKQVSQAYIQNNWDGSNPRHAIVRENENMFNADIFYEDDEVKQQIEGHYDIVTFRPKFEYLDFEFEFVLNPEIDSKIKDMFVLEGAKLNEKFVPKKTQRSFDSFQYYEFPISYHFDSSKAKLDPKDYDYKRIQLMTLKVTDPLFDDNEYLAAQIQFYLEWYNEI